MRSELTRELEIPTGDTILFAGDMHLERPDTPEAKQLLRLLDKGAADNRHLVLVGDVFYFYFENIRGIVKKFRWLTDSLRDAANRWGSVVFVRGNRDFLAGEGGQFPEQVHLADDFLLLRNGKRRILVTHGDLFLKENPSYFRFRRFMRSGFLRWGSRNFPPSICALTANMLRWVSFRNSKDKGYEPPEQGMISKAMADHEAESVVFGHFHTEMEPKSLSEVDGDAWCVGSWEQGQSPILKYRDGAFEFTDARTEIEQDG